MRGKVLAYDAKNTTECTTIVGDVSDMWFYMKILGHEPAFYGKGDHDIPQASFRSRYQLSCKVKDSVYSRLV